MLAAVNTGPSGWEIATAVGTLGAAAAAALATIVSARLVKLEGERREDERRASARAFVRAAFRVQARTRFNTNGAPYEYADEWLQVWNEGPAFATDLRLECDTDNFVLDSTELPPVLYPGQRADLGVVRTFGAPSALVTIRWLDESGPHSLDVAKTFLKTAP